MDRPVKRTEPFGFHLRLTTEKDYFKPFDYCRLELTIIQREAEGTRGVSDDWILGTNGRMGGRPEPLSHLTVSCLFQDKRNNDPELGSIDWSKPYGETIAYRSVYSIDLDECERMAACLRRIRKGLDKITATAGYPSSFGALAQRVGHVIGVSGIYCEGPGEYWHWLTPDRIEDTVNGAIRRWHRDREPKESEVTA